MEMKIRGGGSLTFQQDGTRVRMEAVRAEDHQGLYKVWLHGDQGGKLLLGTLIPENGRLALHRTLSIDALERAGCWPQFRASASLAFSFDPQNSGKWYCEQHPEQLVADPVLKQQLKGAMLCRKGEGTFSLAVPFRTDRPLSLNALFCLSQVERWEGRTHLVWTFDQEGRPKIPNKLGQTGHTNL